MMAGQQEFSATRAAVHSFMAVPATKPSNQQIVNAVLHRHRNAGIVVKHSTTATSETHSVVNRDFDNWRE
jgi:hypothetical protein